VTQPLIGRHDPRGGIWSRVKDADGRIHDGAWRTAIATLQHVGIHAHCGGLLTPHEPDVQRHVTFYPAFCVQCGAEVMQRVAKPRKPKKGAKA